MNWLLDTRCWALETTYLNRLEQHLPTLLQGSFEGVQLPNYRQKKQRSSFVFAVIPDDGEETNPPDCLYYISPDNQQHESDVELKQGSTAVLNIIGPITKRGGMCSYGTKDYAAHFRKAVANSNVDSIVIVADTPGGAVDGIDELLHEIRQSKKPVVGFVDGTCASLGYYILSQTDFIITNSKYRSWIGSIGTLITHMDQSEFLKKVGIKVTHITATKSTEKMIGNSEEPLTEEVIAKFRKELDVINEQFIKDVRAGRGDRLKSEDVFKGGIFLGGEAKNLGLVDAVGTIESALVKARSLASNKKEKDNTKKNNNKANSNTMGIFGNAGANNAQALVMQNQQLQGMVQQKDHEITQLRSALVDAQSQVIQLQNTLNAQMSQQMNVWGAQNAAPPLNIQGGGMQFGNFGGQAKQQQQQQPWEKAANETMFGGIEGEEPA